MYFISDQKNITIQNRLVLVDEEFNACVTAI